MMPRMKPSRRVAGVALFAALAFPNLARAERAERKPLLVQVDHFYLVASDAERLFRLFRDDFGLPEAWPFKSYGDFASGAVTLGNTAMEFVAEKGAAGQATRFQSIAFEPVGDAAAAIAELEARGVAHGPEVPHMYTHEGREFVGWSTVALDGVPPAGAAFICDYKPRAIVAEGRRAASDALARSGGGPLGVTSIREIVIAAPSVEETARAWTRIAEFQGEGSAPVFTFGPGPRIRLERGRSEGIDRIVLGVRSADRAKAFLRARGMLAKGRGPLAIAPAAVGGLEIELVEE